MRAGERRAEGLGLFWWRGFRGGGMMVVRLSGRVAGGFTGPEGLSWVVGAGSCWRSGGLGQGGDALPGVLDVGGPGPGAGDCESSAAVGEAGCGVQDAVAQCFGFGCGEVAVEGEEFEPGEQDGGGHGRGEPGGVDRQRLTQFLRDDLKLELSQRKL